MEIQDIVKRIVAAVKPARIYLFGSRGRGEYTPDSDYDILILMPDKLMHSSRDVKSRIRQELWDLTEPLDLLVYTEREFSEWKNSINHVLGHAAREGHLIYG